MKYVIGIEAGHGGYNKGTYHNEDGLYEYRMTLDVATRAVAKVAWSAWVVPVLIRQEDIALFLSERNGIAERANCDAVVSIHFNWSDNPSRGGGELYHREIDQVGRSLGVEILAALPRRDWRAWSSEYRVSGILGSTGAYNICKTYKMPCALIEFGFLSNKADRDWIKDDGIEKCSQAIADGCDAWAKLKGEK